MYARFIDDTNKTIKNVLDNLLKVSKSQAELNEIKATKAQQNLQIELEEQLDLLNPERRKLGPLLAPEYYDTKEVSEALKELDTLYETVKNTDDIIHVFPELEERVDNLKELLKKFQDDLESLETKRTKDYAKAKKKGVVYSAKEIDAEIKTMQGRVRNVTTELKRAITRLEEAPYRARSAMLDEPKARIKLIEDFLKITSKESVEVKQRAVRSVRQNMGDTLVTPRSVSGAVEEGLLQTKTDALNNSLSVLFENKEAVKIAQNLKE